MLLNKELQSLNELIKSESLRYTLDLDFYDITHTAILIQRMKRPNNLCQI